MKTFFLLSFFAFGLMSCSNSPSKSPLPLIPAVSSQETRPDFKKYYDEYGFSGTMALYDVQKKHYVLYNPQQFQQGFPPASTFKICNSLIGLETGIITDENFVIPWDGTKHDNKNWNQDLDLKTAFQKSALWYYQELTKRVGIEKTKYWLDKVQYGNADTTGSSGVFWMVGGLRISPEQQIDFLRKLHENQLPFSQRNMDIVKRIMVMDTLEHNTLMHAKNGWVQKDSSDLGWFVGYIENEKKEVYYFANCLQHQGKENPNFGQARKDIVYKALADLGWAKPF